MVKILKTSIQLLVLGISDDNFEVVNQKLGEEQKGMLIYKIAFSLFHKINQSALGTHDWVLNGQSHFDWVFYKYMYHWNF